MKRRARGFNLVEMLIAMGMGLALMAAFVLVLQRARRDFAAAESLSRLQDSARHALGVLVADIEHAGFYGLAPAGRARLTKGGATVAEWDALSQHVADRSVAAVAGLPPGAHDCGVNFAVDVFRPVQGADNAFALGSDARDCAPAGTAAGAVQGADTLTLRHASLQTVAPREGRLQVYSTGMTSTSPVALFADGRAPGPVDENHEVRDLEVRSFYVAKSSVGRPGWPALRVKSLTEARGAVQFRDEEIMPGVEDLQAEFAVAAIDSGALRIRFVTAASARAATGCIIAVRLWLRVRADVTEPGYRDDRTLEYANVTFTPRVEEARQRRQLLRRTVALRNLACP